MWMFLLREWWGEMLTKKEELIEAEKIKSLEKFIIDNGELEDLESELTGFNIFEAIGSVRQELRHSDFLAFILNPNNNHGLGDVLLKRILIDIISHNKNEKVSALDIQLNNLENIDIRREWRNIDLLLLLRDLKTIFVIENKVGSRESKTQLKNYSEIISSNFGKEYSVVKVLLTPEGIPPENDDSWGIYSYERIAQQIDIFLQKKEEELNFKTFKVLEDYLILLRRHVVPDKNLVELCQKIYREHKVAIDLIFEHKMDLYSEISAYLIEKLKADKDVVLDDSGKTYIRFRSKVFDTIPVFDNGDGWTSTKKILLYEFQNYNETLRLKLIIGPGKREPREALFSMYVENKKDLKNGNNKLAARWSQITRLDILSKNHYEEMDFEVIKERVDSFWDNFKRKEFLKIDEFVSKAFK
jgi:hypothetical protein